MKYVQDKAGHKIWNEALKTLKQSILNEKRSDICKDFMKCCKIIIYEAFSL